MIYRVSQNILPRRDPDARRPIKNGGNCQAALALVQVFIFSRFLVRSAGNSSIVYGWRVIGKPEVGSKRRSRAVTVLLAVPPTGLLARVDCFRVARDPPGARSRRIYESATIGPRESRDSRLSHCAPPSLEARFSFTMCPVDGEFVFMPLLASDIARDNSVDVDTI
jgi:hypothetical protein